MILSCVLFDQMIPFDQDALSTVLPQFPNRFSWTVSMGTFSRFDNAFFTQTWYPLHTSFVGAEPDR
ncbi:MAG: hypothetical protein DLM68_15980 [Hyphomicrobiales bacterium]|nr:MAG: hypothetical protein DLM68_15980 [Hyphomicrobiales bacterium]